MIEKQYAEQVKEHSLKAISELSQALNLNQGRCSQEDFDRLRKGVGLSIGHIQTELLDVIYAAYPELDDLN